MNIGFSTGSIALGDFKKAIIDLNQKRGNVIELSALRESELEPLLNSIDGLNLVKYDYISFHAPSKLDKMSEARLVDLLKDIARRKWHIIVHPDIIKDFSLWASFGEYLCLENMDKRKEIGRTAYDMAYLFDRLPEASFCFDIAHVRQVDPTLMEGIKMINLFRERLVQLHVSEVNTESKHQPLTFESIVAFNTLAQFIPRTTPIVLESPVSFELIDSEIEKTESIFNNGRLLEMLKPFKDVSVNFHDKIQTLMSCSISL
jgi:hypothetical protein